MDLTNLGIPGEGSALAPGIPQHIGTDFPADAGEVSANANSMQGQTGVPVTTPGDNLERGELLPVASCSSTSEKLPPSDEALNIQTGSGSGDLAILNTMKGISLEGRGSAEVACVQSQISSLSSSSLSSLETCESHTRLPKTASSSKRHWRVLVIGDGDLSYSCALIRGLQLPRADVTLVATTYDERAALIGHYPWVEGNLDALSAAGVPVLHGVDAANIWTSMKVASSASQIDPGTLFEPFDRVVFNFPHSTEWRKIQAHRKLLSSFFMSCASQEPRGEEDLS
eukprot:CAMPEP_0197862914 /NCGR_PEP_ID=MMETSP1438-20131217/40018_1 /TAXON_ID=1461541 /ORGANISM="Pterosperma sp., Strain CCMP1384" /LENGTH=283 /DNA_ID=CAMNT_0043480631 /DNA_START=762 /DNA_END=1609 /DNA_ORIENTATION=-